MSLGKTIGKNTFYGVADKVTQMGTRLILVPIVTAHIGLEGYGVWAIIVVIMAHMRFGAIGIKSAFQKYVAEATGSGNYDRANRLLSTGALGILILSLLGLIPVAIFSHAIAGAMGVPAAFLAETANACTVLAMIMVISNFAGVYEAVIMGAHRIDIVKKVTIVFLVLEAVAITFALSQGCGIFCMALIMAFSELGRMGIYFALSFSVAPKIRLKRSYVSRDTLPELLRFAGTYQLSNILEVVYVAVLPIAVMKLYGADAAGIFAISQRLVLVGALFLESLLLPLLSGGAKVHGSGSNAEMESLLHKSFKAALVFAMLPLGFVAFFGDALVMAWVGEHHEFLHAGLWFFCLARFFRSLSMICFVFYRATGGAMMDLIRQGARIVGLIVLAAMFGPHIDYYQLMAGFALIELLGMVFFFVALKKVFDWFDANWLSPYLLKIMGSLAVILAACALVSTCVTNIDFPERWLALVEAGVGAVVFVIVGIPCLWISRYLSKEELTGLRGVMIPFRAQRGKGT